MTGRWIGLAVGGVLAACGGSGGTAGFINPFPGTCIEPLFQCLQASGTPTCMFNAASGEASLRYPNGAVVKSASRGTQPNRGFGPMGQFCFQMTRISDTTRDYGSDRQVVYSGETAEVRCPGEAPVRRPRPPENPAEEDLRRCAP